VCGIAGWLGRGEPDPDLAARMMAALRHRGPDATGCRSWPEAALVHTRLSIIDLASTGAQPMGNEDGTVWIVFNGEIYNHREHRQRLEARGHVFRGHSDAEILPHLYEEEGANLVAVLRGMFAFAIYDSRRRRLLLARDRFGIKPLFYTADAGRLGFASEINALRLLPGVDDRPDRQAIYDFAALTYIPAPQTFYAGIRSLEPGELLEAEFDGEAVEWTVRRYHRWSIAPDPSLTLDGAIDRADRLLEKAVQSQLESDVPLGSLLSGGIDSSLVSEAAQRGVPGGVKTFNVSFADSAYDETWAALEVARSIGSQHQTLHMDAMPGSWEHVTGLLRHAGQPFADTSIFAVSSISRLMRKHVTVALSGDGGDEAFGGYESYLRIQKILTWQSLPVAARRAGVLGARALARMAVMSERLPQRIRELSEADDVGILDTLQCWVRADERAQLSRADGLLPVRRLFEPQWEYRFPRKASRLERLSAHNTEINVRLRLPNDYLFKVDMASMRDGLEVRVPFLDEDLFDFGMTLPHRLRVDGALCKRVLREIAGRRLPAAVARKPKMGFSIPVDSWVTAEFKSRLRDYLLGPSSKLPEYFWPDVYRPMVEAFCDGRGWPEVSRAGLYHRVIVLLATQIALE
jgi:asparagine synthase (glutamine-hydrolysing)